MLEEFSTTPEGAAEWHPSINKFVDEDLRPKIDSEASADAAQKAARADYLYESGVKSGIIPDTELHKQLTSLTGDAKTGKAIWEDAYSKSSSSEEADAALKQYNELRAKRRDS